MGVFFTKTQSTVPAITAALKDALLVNPAAVPDPESEAASRAATVVTTATPTFNAWRFAGAVAIATALLLAAIWAAQHNLPDISKTLMNSFVGFSGVALGLLGGEAQKSV